MFESRYSLYIIIIQYQDYKSLRRGTSNSYAVLLAGLYLLGVEHSVCETCKKQPLVAFLKVQIWKHVAFLCKHVFPEQFPRGTKTKKKNQLGKSDLCFFFQGVLKLVRNSVLCLGNTRPLNSPLITQPLAPQHKQHWPNTRQGLYRPLLQPTPPHLCVIENMSHRSYSETTLCKIISTLQHCV